MSDYKKSSSSYGEKKDSFGKRNYGDNKGYGRKSDDNRGYGKKFDSNKGYGKKFDDNKGYGKKLDDNKGYGKKFDDNKGYGKKLDDNKGYGKKFDDNKGYGKKFDDNKRYGKKFDDSNSFSKRDYSEKHYEKRDYHDNIDNAVREDELPFIIMGRNAVREAIKSGRSIDKILVITEKDGSLGEIVSLARDKNILIQETTREKLDEICMPFGHGEKSGNHQGIIARVPGEEYVDIEDILDYAKQRDEKPFILLLDGITDPYNFGSIIRSAECAGVHGIIIPKRRSATLTSAVVKVAAGAASHMKVAKVSNIASAIDILKENGLWIAGTDMEGDSMYSTDMKGAMALVIGSEDEGISELVRKKCDYIVSAPIKGHIDSLNAAVAAAVVMFEKVRQDAQ